MKKKTYEQPKMKVVQLEQTDIICASTPGTFSLGADDTIEQGNNSDWGTNLDW